MCQKKKITHTLSLAVFEHNRVARHCYDELGFRQTKKAAGFRTPFGENWKLLVMEYPVKQYHVNVTENGQ